MNQPNCYIGIVESDEANAWLTFRNKFGESPLNLAEIHRLTKWGGLTIYVFAFWSDTESETNESPFKYKGLPIEFI